MLSFMNLSRIDCNAYLKEQKKKMVQEILHDG